MLNCWPYSTMKWNFGKKIDEKKIRFVVLKLELNVCVKVRKCAYVCDRIISNLIDSNCLDI